jgi:arylsulfatase A-like enzyme
MHPPNLEEGLEGEYLTDRLTDEAINFIKEEKDNHFFIYFPHYAVHTPIQAHDSLVEYYQSKVSQTSRHKNAAYAAMVHSMDHSLGRLRKTLELLEIDSRTAIFFTSDNGGLELRNITDNGVLRAGKGSAYEGGVRVPFIAYIPQLALGALQIDVPVIGMDLYPTILDLAGIEVVTNDGQNLLPMLRDADQRIDRESVFWHYPHYHPGGATPYSAVRKGDYKLIEFFEDGKLELYNLEEDIGESENLSETMPEKLRELHMELQNWRNEVGAQYPSRNTDYEAH